MRTCEGREASKKPATALPDASPYAHRDASGFAAAAPALAG